LRQSRHPPPRSSVAPGNRSGGGGVSSASPGITKIWLFFNAKPKFARKSPHKPYATDWESLAIIAAGAILILAAAIVLVAAHRRRRERNEVGKQIMAIELISQILDDSIADLQPATGAQGANVPGHPRQAVISAYARMEVALALAGLPRQPAEAPREYLDRVLRGRFHASATAVSRLTDLFEWAKFSPHDVPPGMRDQAVHALRLLRADLQAAMERPIVGDEPPRRRHHSHRVGPTLA
jgi:hypothetical protein